MKNYLFNININSPLRINKSTLNIDVINEYFDKLYKIYDKMILYHPNKDNYYYELSELYEYFDNSDNTNILNKDNNICYSYITKKTEIAEKYINELKYINLKIYNEYMNEIGNLYYNYPLYDYLIHQYCTGKCNIESINYEDGLKMAIKLLYKNNKFSNLDNPYQSDPNLIMNYLDPYYNSVYYLRIEHITIERIKKCINTCCFNTIYHLIYICYIIDDVDIINYVISNKHQCDFDRIKYINLSNKIMKNDDIMFRLYSTIPNTISVIPIHLINADFFTKLINTSFDVLYKMKNIDYSIKNIFYDLFPEIICNIDFHKIENIFYIHFLKERPKQFNGIVKYISENHLENILEEVLLYRFDLITELGTYLTPSLLSRISKYKLKEPRFL